MASPHAGTTHGAVNQAVNGLSVSLGYAEDKESNTPNPASFPVPWLGAPNTIFLGNPVSGTSNCGNLPSCFDGGAIRLDNTGSTDVTVSNVLVDDHSSLSGGKTFSLWGLFTVPAGQSVILTQNPPGKNPTTPNFDTSGYPKNTNCSSPITVAPTITFTIAGVSTTLLDSTHILDTGGVDPGSCKPSHNESIQWRPIGATGANTATFTVGPASANQSLGQQVTETATLLDGGGVGLANATVNFSVTNGPDVGKKASGVTDTSGQTQFTFAGTAVGIDTIVASVTTVGSFDSNTASVAWATGSSSTPTPTPAPTLSPSPTPTPVPTVSPSPVQLSNLQVNDTANGKYWSLQSNLQTGVTQYGDRTYAVNSVPTNLVGTAWIRTANGSRVYTGNPTVTFAINQQATVYIAIDTRQTNPGWMDSSWVNTGLTLTDNQTAGHNTFALYAKTFLTGIVNLGANDNGSTNVNMYTVIVQ